MCENQATIENVKVVRGKRDYRCVECCGAIPKGVEHEAYGGLWDGIFETYRTCLKCRDLREALRPLAQKAWGEDCFTFGHVRETIAELRSWSDDARAAVDALVNDPATALPSEEGTRR